MCLTYRLCIVSVVSQQLSGQDFTWSASALHEWCHSLVDAGAYSSLYFFSGLLFVATASPYQAHRSQSTHHASQTHQTHQSHPSITSIPSVFRAYGTQITSIRPVHLVQRRG